MDGAVLRRAIVVAAVLAIITLPVNVVRAERPSPARMSDERPARSTGSILGTAWRGDTTPFPGAPIRLRDVRTGRSIARTVSDGDGRFHFSDVTEGAYVVELVSTHDKVLAVGDLFAVVAGAEAITEVRLSSKTPWVAGFFGNAAAAAIAAASTVGVTAIGPTGRPASPQ